MRDAEEPSRGPYLNLSPSGLPGLAVVFIVVVGTFSLVTISPIVAVFALSPVVAVVGAIVLYHYRRPTPTTHLEGLVDPDKPEEDTPTAS
jgi:hypothetical protein